MTSKPAPRASNLSSRRRGHPAIPVENRQEMVTEPQPSTHTPAEVDPAPVNLTDDPQARTAQVSARVTRARRAAFKAKLAQLGTTMDAEINKCIDDVLSR